MLNNQSNSKSHHSENLIDNCEIYKPHFNTDSLQLILQTFSITSIQIAVFK